MTSLERKAVRSWLMERIAEMEPDAEFIEDESPELMSGLKALLEALGAGNSGPRTVPRRGQMQSETITVCDACGSEACWRGEFMCERARNAGTKEVERP